MNLWTINTQTKTKTWCLRVIPSSQKWLHSQAGFLLPAAVRAGRYLLSIALTSQGKEFWADRWDESCSLPWAELLERGIKGKAPGTSILLFRCSLAKLAWFTVQNTKDCNSVCSNSVTQYKPLPLSLVFASHCWTGIMVISWLSERLVSIY